ncbi:DUF3732 domain-containing protein [Janthinobacterium sp. 64]|uniref:DUF3732 domain-containing protein n=1 Tax=Janthinobacterium sp. 64 TaxID=2035208 RepID=UPI000C2CDD1B|nr:DUF3732 domain-containing protein [Janthinobacterium sp. 64]PKB20196.1 uncharacterized protein DUF3732 [Janthinobacterium sp. 64]
MYFQIKKVILWPKNKREPRILPFEIGKVNVISGRSKTGKSAVIPIIDYCLGAEKCAIPVGVIRENCVWFGIVIDTVEGEKLLARREPGQQQSTSDMFLLEGGSVEIPAEIIDRNSNLEYVKSILNRLAGLSNLDFEPGTTDSFKSRPSFRDLMAFTFQPQNIVANPDVMFFKADTTEHREKLKTIFPYILGTITPELLQARHELEQLHRALKRKDGELRARQAAGSRWQREGQIWLRQAIENGLLATDIVLPSEWSGTIEALKLVLQAEPSAGEETIGSIDAALVRLKDLRLVETDLTLKLNASRQQLKELKRLEDSTDAYAGALQVQRDRLSLSKWIRGLANDGRDVVFEPSEEGRNRLDRLCIALDSVEVRLRSYPRAVENLGRETLRLREATQEILSSLVNVRKEITSIEDHSKVGKQIALRRERNARFLGGLEEAIRLYEIAEPSSDLSGEIAKLQERIQELTPIVAEHEVRRKVQAALTEVEGYAAKLVPQLDGEWPEAPIKLIIKELTVKVARGSRDDYLWEIGSGANWLAYHVAMTLALQGFFLNRPGHPVPGMLIFDQPSQVYFPTRRARSSFDTDEHDPKFRDVDLEAVRKVFSLFSKVISKKGNAFQIIVLDHADGEVWGGLPNVELVEEWRGNALVPPEWIIE